MICQFCCSISMNLKRMLILWLWDNKMVKNGKCLSGWRKTLTYWNTIGSVCNQLKSEVALNTNQEKLSHKAIFVVELLPHSLAIFYGIFIFKIPLCFYAFPRKALDIKRIQNTQVECAGLTSHNTISLTRKKHWVLCSCKYKKTVSHLETYIHLIVLFPLLFHFSVFLVFF